MSRQPVGDSLEPALVGFRVMRGPEAPKRLLARYSCGFWGPSGAEQLQQVRGQAHQFPLAANVVQPTQAEAPEASPLLDLSEDRFHDRFAHFVNGSSGHGTQFVPHGFLCRSLHRRRKLQKQNSCKRKNISTKEAGTVSLATATPLAHARQTLSGRTRVQVSISCPAAADARALRTMEISSVR